MSSQIWTTANTHLGMIVEIFAHAVKARISTPSTKGIRHAHAEREELDHVDRDRPVFRVPREAVRRLSSEHGHTSHSFMSPYPRPPSKD